MPPGTTHIAANNDPTSASALLFNGSNNACVTGSTFNIYQHLAHGNDQLDHNNGSFDAEYRKLRSASLDTASIDSQAAENLPSCYKGTREDIIRRVMEWIREDSQTPSLMWLHGPAGAGKTAIGSTIAQQCEEKKILIAAFFGSILLERCRSEETLPFISTIALQLVAALPDSLQFIGHCIRRDPGIFGKRLAHQLDNLVVNPLNASLHALSARRLILIDGIHDCSPPQYQQSLLGALTKKIEKFTVPVRILVITRPEPYVARGFSLISKTIHFQSIDLSDGTRAADCDIQRFFQERLEEIRNEHHLLQPWPAPEDIQKLVVKASGQFIYAAAALDFIGMKALPRADARLNIFLGRSSSSTQDAPFEKLDRTFNATLDVIPSANVSRTREILAILMIHRSPSDGLGTYNTPKHLEYLLDLESGEVLHALEDLYSLLRINDAESPIVFHHASLVDFLMDPTRVNERFGPIDVSLAHEKLARNYYRLLSRDKVLDNVTIRKCHDYLFPCFAHSALAKLSTDLIQDIITFDILSLYEKAICRAGRWDKEYVNTVRLLLDRYFRVLRRKDVEDGYQLCAQRIAELTQCIEEHLDELWMDERLLDAFAVLTSKTGLKPVTEPSLSDSSEISEGLLKLQYLTLMYCLSPQKTKAFTTAER